MGYSRIEDRDANGFVETRPAAFSANDGFSFAGQGVKGTATKTSTTNIDLKMTAERCLNGIELFLQDQEWDDDMKLQVVDVDDVLGGGAGAVLSEYGADWNMATDQERQGPYLLAYPAVIPINIYIRIVYVSTGTVNNVKVKANYFLHEESA
jgi:hypothetical protein